MLAFSLITLVFVVLTFTIIGPLGSYRSLSLFQRLVYMIVLAWPGSVSVSDPWYTGRPHRTGEVK